LISVSLRCAEAGGTGRDDQKLSDRKVSVQVERKRHRGVQRRLESRNHYAALSWMGSLFSDLALARRACLRSSGTDSSSRRKSAMRSIWWHLDAVAIPATMSCQDRSGLAFLSNMTRDNARESCVHSRRSLFGLLGIAQIVAFIRCTLHKN
jgi:hypothetical protein